MPRLAAARKPAPALPAPRKKKASARARKPPPTSKTRVLTPTEHQKVWLAGLMLGAVLLGLALHTGELLPTDDGWSFHLHDLRGAVVLNVELSTHHWPRVAFR